MSEIWILLLFQLVAAQQKSCYSFVGTVPHTIPGALPQCDYMNNHYDSCTAGPTSDRNNCVCNQKLFNAIYECAPYSPPIDRCA